MAGVVGRTGEALLNEVLGRGGYRRVVALADAPMSLGVRQLELAAIDALPAIDDVYVLVSDPAEQGSRSYYGRDAPFVQVDDALAVRVASAAAAAGAGRLVLISPTPAWQQISKLHHGLASESERRIATLPIATMLVLRPTRAARAAAGNFLQRIVHGYLSIQLLMLPKSIPTITSPQLARVALDALGVASPGISVMAAQDIAERAGSRGSRA